MNTLTESKVHYNTGRPDPPTLFFRGRRIPVGEARLAGDGWCWWRRVRKEQRGRLQAHWWHERGGWVIGYDLFQQVSPWAAWTLYEDEDGGEWWIESTKIPQDGERIAIQGRPHWFVAARHWDYKPPARPSIMQISLW